MKIIEFVKKKTFKYWIDIYLYNNNIVLPIVRNGKGVCTFCILLLILPYLVLNYLYIKIYERVYGYGKIQKIIDEEKKKEFDYELAVVTCSKDESLYLLEWIEFYRLMGVDHIYFYDNGSSDNTKSLLMPYVDIGYVTYTYVEGRGKQLEAYNNALSIGKKRCRWMAFIDMDEYIIPSDPNKKIIEVVNDIISGADKGAAGIAINWATYGTSGFRKRPKGLITHNYIKRANKKHFINKHIKTICNPRLVKFYISPHYPFYKRGAFSVFEFSGHKQIGWATSECHYKNLRINHYMTKSAEDYMAKCRRGLGDREENYLYDSLKQIDYADVKDTIAWRYTDELQKRLKDYPIITL